MDETTQDVEQFIAYLAKLSEQLGRIYRSGDISVIGEMNATVKELYRLQHGNQATALQTIDEECKIIYANFDMMIAVLRTTEDGEIDPGAQKAIGKFLQNINQATVNIAAMFGLV